MRKIIVFILISFLIPCIFGCGGGSSAGIAGGSWESGGGSTVNPESQKLIEVNGSLLLSAAPYYNSPSRAIDINNGKYSVLVVDKDNINLEIGTVTVTGSSYKAVIPVTSLNMFAMIVIKDKENSKLLYRTILGRILKLSEMPSGVNVIRLNGIALDERSTARALFAEEKGIPDIPVAQLSSIEAQSGVITKDYTGIKTEFDEAAENLAGGASNILQVSNSVLSVISVLISSELNQSSKNLIAPDEIIKISQLLSAFVKSLNNSVAKSVITAAKLATSISISNSNGSNVISSQTNTADITSALNGIVVAESAAKPVFNPAEGVYTSDQNVSISSATAGATIRYTIDGSIPGSTNGYIYNGPVQISTTTTIKAISIKTGYTNSVIASAAYTLPPKVATPIIAPGSGTYSSAQSVTISCATAGAVIKYTIDGSVPSETVGSTYLSPITVSSTMIIKAIALKSGITNSNAASASYVINTATAAAPVISPSGGTFNSVQSVSMVSSTDGAVIKYTTDGSVPSASNGLTYSTAITISTAMTIKAIAIKTGMADSSVTTAAFIIQETVASPIFNPPAGSYAAAQSVTIQSATSGAAIFYTLDGSTPTMLSTQYNSPISVSATKTIKAIAIKTGMAASSAASATYNILEKVSIASFNPAAGSYSGTTSVAIATATTGASIYYTLDGSTPTAASSLYTSSVSISSSATIKALAVKSGMADSDMAVAAYVISFPAVSEPSFSVASGTYNSAQSVAISTTTTGASIYYTLDGSAPTSASSLYTSSVSITSTKIIKAIAVKTGMSNSSISVASYVIDTLAPVFSVQYYSDSALSLSLGNNPHLSAGAYYLKISSNKELRNPPSVSISAEGSANDVSAAASALVSGNDYKYSRTITSDAAAIGSVLEDISISATDIAGNVANNINPSDESTKAAYTDTVAPTASITYSPASFVKQGSTLVISAVISENLAASPALQISISGANTLSAVNMTSSDASHYSYSHTAGAGNGSAAIALSAAKDLAGNLITAAPSSGASFGVDNTAPTAPTGVAVTPTGGTVIANTLNLTNTNMTATASITAGEAAGGKAELYVAAVKAATDSSIASGDTAVTFDCGQTTAVGLQSLIAAGGAVSVKLIDAAGNEAVSSVANPTLIVDYAAPAAPTGVAVTPAGGTIVANTLNSTNTNMTASATITAATATGGIAQLLIDGTVKAQDTSIAAGDASVTFDLAQTTASGLQSAVPSGLNGKVVSVKLIDAAGNEAISSVSNPSIAVDYTAPTATVSYLPSIAVNQGTSITIMATFSEAIADSPVMQVAITGSNTLSASNMSKTDSTHYAYIHSVGAGNGAANISFSTATDVAGNPVTAAPTSGASFSVDNTAPTCAITSTSRHAAGDSIVLSFSKTMNQNTLTQAGIRGGATQIASIKHNGAAAAGGTLLAQTTATGFWTSATSFTLILEETTDVSFVPNSKYVELIFASGAVKDMSGNAVSNSPVYTSAAVSKENTVPAITSLSAVTVHNGNDYVDIVFSEPMDQVAAETLANWNIQYDDDAVAGGETTLTKTNATLSYDKTNMKLRITLSKVTDSAYFPNSKYAKVTPSAAVIDLVGNAIAASGVYSSSAAAGDLTAPNALQAGDLSKLSFNNALHKVAISSGPLTANVEPCILQAYIGASTPDANTVVTASSSIKVSTGHADGDSMTGFASATTGHGVWYRYIDGAGNKSSWLQDGTVPAAPDATKLGYSRASQTFVSLAAGLTALTSTSAILKMWQADDASNTAPVAKGTLNGIDLSAKTGNLVIAQTIDNPKYVAYTIADADGNESAYSNDGQVPAAPSLPVASSLIGAGDGGTGAPAGYINNSGKAAATIRPLIALSANQTLNVTINKTNSIKISATASAGATPVFGGTTANITYSAVISNSGNSTSGAFDFTTAGNAGTEIAEGSNVAVSASLVDANGNESNAGAAVNVSYDKTLPSISSWAMDMSPNADSKLISFAFNESITAANFDATKISAADSSGANPLALTEAMTQTPGANSMVVTAIGATSASGLNAIANASTGGHNIGTAVAADFTLILAGDALIDAAGNKSAAKLYNAAPSNPSYTADSVAPKIALAVTVNPYTTHTITFDDYMDSSSVVSGNFTCAIGGFAQSAAYAPLTLTWIFATGAEPANLDTILANNTVKDLGGNAIDANKDNGTYSLAAHSWAID